MEYNNQMFKDSSSHKKYSRISPEKRSKLISRVLEQGISVVKASKKLGIKISTAKLILKKYKETGAIFQKKMPNYRRKDLRDPPATSQDQENGQNELRERTQNTSMEKKLQRVEGQGQDCRLDEPSLGLYWCWPVFYYQI